MPDPLVSTLPLSTPRDTVASLFLGPWLDGARRHRAGLDATTLRPPAELTWATPGAVVFEHPLLNLREVFVEPREGARIEGAGVPDPGAAPAAGLPFFLVAPEVNGATIADYGPGQSLLHAALDAGFPRVFVVVWRSATSATKDATLGDSIRAIEAALDAVGGPVHLAGICQGGWAAAIVASRRPEKVASLTLIASAIAFKAGDAVLSELVDGMPHWVYEAMVGWGGGVMRGDFLNSGFDLLQGWERLVVGPLRTFNRLDDEAHLEREALLHRWYGARKDLPGPMYLQVVDDLFRHDRLARGELRLDGDSTPVDLRAIVAPLALVAGSKDHITPPEQVFALEGLASSTLVRRELLDAGHVGVCIGRSVLRDRWPAIFAFLRGTAPPLSSRRRRRGA